MIKYGWIYIGCFLLAQNGGRNMTIPKVQQRTVAPRKEGFPFPTIPSTLMEPEARKSYLLTHYWERFDFADTILVDNRDVTEQGFVNFIALLTDGTTPDELMRESMENWCRRFIPSTYACPVLMKMADDYLYNPNSPFYNEHLYGMYLEALIKEFPKGDAQISRFGFRLSLLKRNNPGNRATDFTYYLRRQPPHAGRYTGEGRPLVTGVLRPGM